MPINEDALQSKIDVLSVKLRSINTTRSQLEETRSTLISIQKKEKIINEVDGNGRRITRIEMEDPIDEQTHNKMKPARRQEIYDLMITKADLILSA